MLESDAKKKRCPYKMMSDRNDMGDMGDIYCDGSGCMGWDAHRRYIPHEIDKATKATIPAYWMPRDPPEGDCTKMRPHKVFKVKE